jgi:hypothetical protein
MMCKKLILLTLFLVVLGSSSAAFAQPYREEFCITICPAGAGPDDEITISLYHLGEKFDLSKNGGCEMNFWPIAGGWINFQDPEYPGSGIEGFELKDGSIVGVLGEDRYSPYNQWDFFTWGAGLEELGFYENLWYGIAMPDFAEEALHDNIPAAVDDGGDCPIKEGHEFGCETTVFKVSNENPEDGTTGLRHDSDWADPEIDANDYLQGPFEYTVLWGGDDPCKANMVELDTAYSPANCNDVMCFDPCTGDLDPGTTYYWAVDINDLNETDFRPGGDPCFYEGPVFEFTTWGFATLISPENEEGDVDPGLIELLFEGDGYQSSFVVYLLDEGESELANSGSLSADANSWTPTVALGLAQTYKWYVEECNTPGCVATEIYTFYTSICETLDDFEGYSTLEGTGNDWKDFWDDATSDNAVINHLEDATPPSSEAAQGRVYQYEAPGSVKSMNLNIDRDYLDTAASDLYDDFTWFTPSDANLASDGGKSVLVAYRAADPGASPPDSANNEQMFMGFKDGPAGGTNLANIDYPGDVEDPEWSIFFVALSEINDLGTDITDITEIRIGATGDDDNTGTFDVYVDLMTRCGPTCPFNFGDQIEGVPSFTQLLSDFSQDCVVNEDDLWYIIDDWLFEGYTYLVEDPCAGSLMVHYDFDTVGATVPDLSTNGYVGVLDANAPDFSTNGQAEFYGAQYIEVGGGFNSVQPFNDSYAVVIEFQVPVFDGSRCLLSAAPEVPIDANNWDHAFDMKANHFAEGEGDVWQRNRGDDGWHGFTELWRGEGAFDDGWHTVVAGYDPCNGIHLTYLDGFLQTGELNGEWAPELTESLDRYVTMIGDTLDVNNDDSNPLSGLIRDVKIYNDITEAQIRSLGGEEVGIHVIESSVNIAGSEPAGEGIVNFLDHAEFAKQWLEENLFE